MGIRDGDGVMVYMLIKILKSLVTIIKKKGVKIRVRSSFVWEICVLRKEISEIYCKIFKIFQIILNIYAFGSVCCC